MAQLTDTVPPDAPKTRFEARLGVDLLALVKRAAKLQGRTVTAFVTAALREAAKRVVEEDAIVRVSLEDQRRIAKALINPPKENAALRRAFARRREMLAPE